jgi:hypothetical protein
LNELADRLGARMPDHALALPPLGGILVNGRAPTLIWRQPLRLGKRGSQELAEPGLPKYRKCAYSRARHQRAGDAAGARPR